MRKRFQGELDKLHKMLLNMDMTIKNNIDMMLTALKNNNRKLVKEVIDSDDLVDNWELEIEEFCIDIIIRQQPVAGDLREITSILKMITHLQRKSGRQSMLSVIISMKMQRKQCRRRLTGCWLQKQVDRQRIKIRWM